MALDIERIAERVDNLKNLHSERDFRMSQIQAVRKGQLANIFPDMFPEGLPYSMIANFIDVAARDLAEVLAPLPSFNCGAVKVTDVKARKFADKRSMMLPIHAFSHRCTGVQTGTSHTDSCQST